MFQWGKGLITCASQTVKYLLFTFLIEFQVVPIIVSGSDGGNCTLQKYPYAMANEGTTTSLTYISITGGSSTNDVGVQFYAFAY